MGNERRTQRSRRPAERHDAGDLVQLTRLDESNYDQAVHRLVNNGPEPCRESGAETAPGCDCDDCAEHRAEFAAWLEPGEQVTGRHCRSCDNRWARGEPHFDEGF